MAYDSDMNGTNGQPVPTEGGLAGLLQEHSISGGVGKDIALVERAVRRKWPMKPEVRLQMMKRLGEIVAKASVTIPTNEGETVENEAVADRNAIAAANVLRMMEEEDRDAAFRGAEFIQRERFKVIDKKVPNAPQDHRHFVVPPPRQLGGSDG
jgi:hypothetical protein